MESADVKLKCSENQCAEDVYIACPLCCRPVCYDHKEITCCKNGKPLTQEIKVLLCIIL